MAAARQVRPPKPSRQAHCPVNCGGERVSERDSPAHPSRRGSRQDTSSAVRPRTAPPQAHVFGPAKAESHREGRSGGSPGAWGPARRYLVALGAEGVVRVAGTGLAAPAAGQLPVVGGTLVTLGAHHVGQTQAAPSLLVTRHVPPGAQDTAVTPCTGEGPLSWGRGTQICPHHPPEDTHPISRRLHCWVLLFHLFCLDICCFGWEGKSRPFCSILAENKTGFYLLTFNTCTFLFVLKLPSEVIFLHPELFL